jgi:hypothetical protein
LLKKAGNFFSKNQEKRASYLRLAFFISLFKDM